MSKNWIQTASNLKFDLLVPTADMVVIDDIAHALSRICRYTGHTNRHYSVAEHSLHVSDILRRAKAPAAVQLQGLMHDATEAYCGDVTSPLKALLPQYRVIEDGIWDAIAEKFNLPRTLDPAVKDADMIALMSEKQVLLGPSPEPWFAGPDKWQASEHTCLAIAERCYSIATKGMFLDRWRALTRAVRLEQERAAA